MCSFEYTLKLQQMFQDIGISKNLIDQYRLYCEKRKLDDIGKNSLKFKYNISYNFILS